MGWGRALLGKRGSRRRSVLSAAIAGERPDETLIAEELGEFVEELMQRLRRELREEVGDLAGDLAGDLPALRSLLEQPLREALAGVVGEELAQLTAEVKGLRSDVRAVEAAALASGERVAEVLSGRGK